jgi:flagellar basal-body rod protein FlgB
MAITDLPILSMLRTRLEWGQERQRVLAENIANSDTPNFQARDLAQPDFGEPGRVASPLVSSVSLLRTDEGHIPGLADAGSGFHSKTASNYDIRPTGNAVNLEEEMMKVAANQMDYQAVSALYARSLNMFKTALGKR